MSNTKTLNNKKVKKQMDMLHGPLVKNLMIFALPLAATGILQQLFNAADIAVVGKFAGTHAMAAVGSCGPLVGLLVNVFLGLSIGSNVLIARFIGQGSEKKASRALHTAIPLSVLAGLVICFAGQILTKPMMTVLSVPEEVQDLASTYLRIYFAAMPFVALYNFESAIFRSQGNTKTPLMVLCLSGVINVILNLLFVIKFDMSVAGVATATLIANIVSSIVLFFILVKSDGMLKLHPRKMKFHKDVISFVFRVGIPAAIQGMVTSVSNMVLQSSINSLGATIIAGSSAAFNIEILTYFIINSFGQAATTFVGQNYGAGNVNRCREIARKCMILDLIWTLALTVFTLGFSPKLVSIFNSDPAVIAVGVTRLKVILTSQCSTLVIEVLSGALRGYGKSLAPALVTMVGICGVRIVWIATVFQRIPAFSTIMYSYPVSWAIAIVLLILIYFRTMKKHIIPKYSNHESVQ